MRITSEYITSRFHVRPASPGDGTALAPKLRGPDLDELRACTREDPASVLEAGCAASSPCYAVIDGEGKILGLFGVVPVPGQQDAGAIWLLGSDALVEHRIAFLRASRCWLRILQRTYRGLGNYIDQRNSGHLEWLRWMGFEISSIAERRGIENRPFLKFRLIRDSAPSHDQAVVGVHVQPQSSLQAAQI